MRVVLYALAAVTLAGFAAGLRHSSERTHKHEPRSAAEHENTVYVDIDRLVSLHPAWSALQGMRRVHGEGQGSVPSNVGGGFSAVVNDVTPASLLRPVDAVAPTVSRQQLEANAAIAAIMAMHELEQEKRRSLWERIGSIRETMTRAAEADVAAKARDIMGGVEKDILAIERTYRDDRVRTELKIGALQSALGIREVDTEPVQTRLAELREQLDRIDGECDAQKQSVVSAADGRIAEMRKAAMSEVDSHTRTLEIEGAARIDDEIARARDRIVEDLSTTSIAGRIGRSTTQPNEWLFEDTGRPVVRVPVRRETNEERSVDLLAQRVRRDIVRVVGKLAAEKGFNVVFEHSGVGVADQTDLFARLVRDQGWREFRPVLSEAVRI